MTAARRYDEHGRTQAGVPRARALLSAYFPLGDPQVDESLLEVYADAGVDIVELGVPSPSPHLDGPDVRASMQRALDADSDIAAALDRTTAWLAGRVGRPRALCMGYADMDFGHTVAPPVMARLFALLMLDMDARPDAADLHARLRAADVRRVGLVPPACTPGDIAAAREIDGYVMLQAASGVTGPRPTLDPRNRETISRLRQGGVRAPILLGFGIGTPAQAQEAIAFGADGVVVGSMCLRMAQQGRATLAEFLRALRTALDDARPTPV